MISIPRETLEEPFERWGEAPFNFGKGHWFRVKPVTPLVGFTKSGNPQLLMAEARPLCRPELHYHLTNKVPLLPSNPARRCQACLRIIRNRRPNPDRKP